MPIQPISPVDIIKIVPEEIIEIFNKFIQENFDGTKAVFKIKDITPVIASKMNVSHAAVLDKKWLDVEPIYRSVGWKVTYNFPDRDQDFESYFEFIK